MPTVFELLLVVVGVPAAILVGAFAVGFLRGLMGAIVGDWRRLRASGPLDHQLANYLFNYGLLLTRSATAALVAVIAVAAWQGWPLLPWSPLLAGAVLAFVWRVKKVVRGRMDRSVATGGHRETNRGMGGKSR